MTQSVLYTGAMEAIIIYPHYIGLLEDIFCKSSNNKKLVGSSRNWHFTPQHTTIYRYHLLLLLLIAAKLRVICTRAQVGTVLDNLNLVKNFYKGLFLFRLISFGFKLLYGESDFDTINRLASSSHTSSKKS